MLEFVLCLFVTVDLVYLIYHELLLMITCYVVCVLVYLSSFICHSMFVIVYLCDFVVVIYNDWFFTFLYFICHRLFVIVYLLLFIWMILLLLFTMIGILYFICHGLVGYGLLMYTV